MPGALTIPVAGVPFEVRDDPDRPAWFLYGVRKSGSSILNSMAASLARMNDVAYVDVAGGFFRNGVDVRAWQNDPGLAALLRGGNLYGGFRNAPLGLAEDPVVRGSRSALLVRDPRDALVSQYFSDAYSHSIPEAGETRDLMIRQREAALRASLADHVLRTAPGLRETLREYYPFLEHPGHRVYQYETAILNKRWFLRDLCDHFGWGVTEGQLDQILGWADVVPEEEDPTRFIRKVLPGDHREKLDARTIAALDAVLAEPLGVFGYAG